MDRLTVPEPGARVIMSRTSNKSKAKDYTDPRRHGYTAKGGPIERIRPAVSSSEQDPDEQNENDEAP